MKNCPASDISLMNGDGAGTTVTQPRAPIDSLIADRWLKNSLLRFFSLNAFKINNQNQPHQMIYYLKFKNYTWISPIVFDIGSKAFWKTSAAG